MPQVKQCASCQTELESDSSDSYCPKCLPHYGVTATAATPPGSEAQTPGQRSFFAAPAPSELAPRFPQLEIVSLLGLGGMGAVYQARQPSLDRFVALKILPAEASREGAFTERFTREARALAKLSHPGIVTVYDFGQSDGLYHFIMEFVDGANLRQLMKEGNLSAEEALRLIPQICDALQYAHDEGVIHRDIKPENILVDKKGRVKIADFGIAKLLGPKTTDHTLTGPWQVMGTMHYMAPEQMETPLGLDHRADIYSVGVVIYEMLTNQLPRGNFPLPSRKFKVDPRLDQIVMRALETEPSRRYQRISEIKTDIEAITAQPILEALPVRTYRKTSFLGTNSAIVQAELRAPAQALMWAGIVDLAVSVVGMIALLFRGSTEMGFAYLMICIGMGVAIVLGSRKMKKLEARGFVLLCAVFAMIPIPPGCLITFPIGAWAWSALRNKAVRKAFQQKLHESVG